MSLARSAFLASAGADLIYVIDEDTAAHADFNSESDGATYRAAHKRTRQNSDTFYYYDQFRHLLFCEKSWQLSGPYGEACDLDWNKPRPGANCYSPVIRNKKANVLSQLNSGVTFSRCLGFTAAHELGHCVGAEHQRPLFDAIRLDYNPLGDGESVTAERLPNTINELSLGKVGGDSFSVPLTEGSAITFSGLAEAISQLDGNKFTASVLENCGGLYSFTIRDRLSACGDKLWIVRHPQVEYNENVVLRHRDQTLMEAPANLINAILVPSFANEGIYSCAETEIMNFTR